MAHEGAVPGKLTFGARHAAATYVAFDSTRQPNEAAANERARAPARAALGEAELERLLAQGSALNYGHIAAIAF